MGFFVTIRIIKLCSIILVHVNIPSIEGYKDKNTIRVPHFSLVRTDEKWLIGSLETKANSRAPSTGLTAHQTKGQPSVSTSEDFITDTQDCLSCIHILGTIN